MSEAREPRGLTQVTGSAAGDVVGALLRDAWGMDVVRLDDVSEGGGADQWAADAADRSRWFVTCDDLPSIHGSARTTTSASNVSPTPTAPPSGFVAAASGSWWHPSSHAPAYRPPGSTNVTA
jgi:hypothetical protein